MGLGQFNGFVSSYTIFLSIVMANSSLDQSGMGIRGSEVKGGNCGGLCMQSVTLNYIPHQLHAHISNMISLKSHQQIPTHRTVSEIEVVDMSKCQSQCYLKTGSQFKHIYSLPRNYVHHPVNFRTKNV